jgi:acetylornithine/succinyldiaminopimelate/putrescine aminotransferase/predicted amino acid dehydrogenase
VKSRKPGTGADGHFKPRLTSLLRTLGLDITFERGEGDSLFCRNADGREIDVLDLVGGYGSLLLGHAHPALVREAQRLLSSSRPLHAQGSHQEYSTRLATELSRRAGGDYCAVFANSGTEAVEIAIKHAIHETGSRTFIALEGAFHGQTLGALQLTADPQFRDEFELSGLRVLRVALNDIDQLERAFADAPPLAGFMFEPIQGEGGVRPVTPAFARRAAQLCAERNTPLIADECQTGVGRTGTFLACEQLGVEPDYVVLSKALGGGLAKISALLIRRQRYADDFDLKHTSTYADDDYSSALALETLRLVDEELLASCRTKGDKLLRGLRDLAAAYPDIIADVRGSGLMIGVEFRPPSRSPSFVLRYLASQEDLPWVVAGYLLHVHRLRVAPTLGHGLTLRLEPSALIDDDDLTRVVAAIEDVCTRLQCHDALALTRHVSERSGSSHEPGFVRTEARFCAYDDHRFRQRDDKWPGARVAWLFHLVDTDDLARLDQQFIRLTSERRERFLDQFAGLAGPIVMSVVDVESLTGERVRLYPILLPFTSAWVKRLMDQRRFDVPRMLVQQGVDLAASLGCTIVSLGQYTSIVTRNGTWLSPRGMGLTTGNSFSIALACDAVQRARADRHGHTGRPTLAVVGATGNIGRTCAEILAPRFSRVILFGSRRPGSEARLIELADRIPGADVSMDPAVIRDADVVVSAINGVDAPLGPSHFARDAIVCDLSIPASIHPGTAAVRPDLHIVAGGVARLPFEEDLEIVGFPLPAGQIYGCAAEAILLGLEGLRGVQFTGPLSPDHVRQVRQIADRHGFGLADVRRVLA